MSGELLLDIDNMSSGYAGVPVVRNLNLKVHAGEVVALLGPNGAGKTTTLITCSGLIPVMSGGITVLGEKVNAKSPFKNARTGMAHVVEHGSGTGHRAANAADRA